MVNMPDANLIVSAQPRVFTAQKIVHLFHRVYSGAGIKGASSQSVTRRFVTKLGNEGINACLVQKLANLYFFSHYAPRH